MLPGTQDKATVPLQLAAIARGDSSQLGGDIEMLVGEDKDASVFRFVVLGQEELDTAARQDAGVAPVAPAARRAPTVRASTSGWRRARAGIRCRSGTSKRTGR